MNNDIYEKVKQNLKLDYRGYDLKKVLSINLLTMVHGFKFSFKSDFINAFTARKIEIPENSNNQILFSMGNYGDRKDYYEIMDYVCSGVESDRLDINFSDKKIVLNLANFISSLLLLRSLDKALSIKERLSICFKVSHYRNTIDYLEGRVCSVKYRRYCSFCSSHAYEAILDLYFQKRQVPTYTLQHGQYFIFKDSTIDLIVYENMVANNLLCWGRFTKDEFMNFGVPEKKLLVAGYPRNVNHLSPYAVQKESLRLLVLCARPKYDLNNKSILKVISSFVDKYPYRVTVVVKTHPSLNQSEYKNLATKFGFIYSEGETIKELIANGGFDFSISYNSTAYVDSYINNLISLHYQDDQRESSEQILSDSFTNDVDLLNKIDYLSSVSGEEETWQEVRSRLLYLVGYGIDKYSDVLDV